MNTTAIRSLIAQFPLVADLIALKETTWFNPRTTTLAEGLPHVGLTQADVDDAHARLARFAPYLASAFPETAEKNGISNPTWSLSLPCISIWKRDRVKKSLARCC